MRMISYAWVIGWQKIQQTTAKQRLIRNRVHRNGVQFMASIVITHNPGYRISELPHYWISQIECMSTRSDGKEPPQFHYSAGW